MKSLLFALLFMLPLLACAQRGEPKFKSVKTKIINDSCVVIKFTVAYNMNIKDYTVKVKWPNGDVKDLTITFPYMLEKGTYTAMWNIKNPWM